MLGPIFVREWLTTPRRLGHYVLRGSYLGFLWILALTAWQAIVGWEQPATIGDHARFAMILFRGYAYLLIQGGRGTVASCMFTGFKRQAEYVERTVAAFRERVGLDMRNPRSFGGFANFRLTF